MILGYTVFFHILQQRFMQLQELLEPIGAFVPVRIRDWQPIRGHEDQPYDPNYRPVDLSAVHHSVY